MTESANGMNFLCTWFLILNLSNVKINLILKRKVSLNLGLRNSAGVKNRSTRLGALGRSRSRHWAAGEKVSPRRRIGGGGAQGGAFVGELRLVGLDIDLALIVLLLFVEGGVLGGGERWRLLE